MKTCPKCGRANDVTRKFCVRCGASLLATAEAAKPKAPAAVVPETGRVTTAASLRGAKEVEGVTEGEETSSADEIRVPSMAAPEETKVTTSSYEMPLETTGEKGSAEVAGVESEKGKEVMKLVLEKVKEAEARAKKEAAAPKLEPSAGVFETAATAEEAEPLVPEREEPKAAVGSSVRIPSVLRPSEEEAKGFVSSVSAAAVSTTADEYLRDEKIRKIELDIKALGLEHKQLQSDLDNLRARLDPEVERYRTAADAKRTRTESIERDLKLAKKEWDDADKEYKNAESHRKKELSAVEKRIEDVDKRTKKAEESKKKRIEEIEKEKQKLEEESKKT